MKLLQPAGVRLTDDSLRAASTDLTRPLHLCFLRPYGQNVYSTSLQHASNKCMINRFKPILADDPHAGNQRAPASWCLGGARPSLGIQGNVIDRLLADAS